MKKIALPIALIFFAMSVSAQRLETAGTDSTGRPGDQFSLAAALSLFERSIDVEGFERALNDTNTHVNNLDLNEDGEVDYIRVVDHADGDAHALVLQVPVSESENQDVAVIELEKPGPDSAIIQIRGDEDLYGKDVVMEPFDEVPIHSKRAGPAMPDAFMGVVVNVWGWNCVRLIYSQRYALWVSPWGWRHYPGWWRPWRPYPWRAYWGYAVRYHRFCRRVNVCHVVRAHNIYVAHRVSSARWHRAPALPAKAVGSPRGVGKNGGGGRVRGGRGGHVGGHRR